MSLRKFSLPAIAAILSLSWAGLASGQDATRGERIPNIMPTNPDQLPVDASKDFLQQMHHFTESQTRVANSALQRSTSTAVKNFADLMLNINQLTGSQIESIAAQQKFVLDATRVDPKVASFFNELQKMETELADSDQSSFDVKFAEMIAASNEQASKLAESASSSLKVVRARELAGELALIFKDRKSRAEELKTTALSH